MGLHSDIDRLVHYFCVAPATARYGPYSTGLPEGELVRGIELIVGRLYRYRLVDRNGQSVDLQAYAGVAGVAGLLWEQEVRLLLRLGGSALPALPKVLDGGYEDEESTARAGVGMKGIALVATRGSDHSLADPGAAETMRQDPLLAITQFMRLAEAITELHDLGAQHRNLVPAAVLADLSGTEPRLWIARFEMSSLIGNLLRHTVDSDASLPELRRLFLGDEPPDNEVLACQPFERLRFLFPEGESVPLLETYTSDVFSLAGVVWHWFCDAAVLTREPLPDALPDRHAELHRRMVAELANSRVVPRRLASLLMEMLDPVPRARPTAAQVHQRINEDLDAIRRSLAGDDDAQPYLLIDNPKEAATSLRSWGLITHGADTDEGRRDIAAFMADDLKHAQLLRSPLGAGPFVRGGDPQDKRNSRSVILGRQTAWFCQQYRRKTWGRFGPPLDEALIIKYVAYREHPSTRRALENLLATSIRIDLPSVEVVSVDVADSVMTTALYGRPSWKPLLDGLGSSSSEVTEDQEYGDALDWLLRYQGAELSARTYAFERSETAGGQVTLQWDPDRERKMINSDALVTKFADSPWLRPAFGSFFQHLEDDEGESQVEIGEDSAGRPSFPLERSVWSILQERAGNDRVILRRSAQGTGHMPERGWIRPLGDTGTRTALTRQVAARWDLLRAHGLLAQLRQPDSIRSLPHRWENAGRDLQGDEGGRIVRNMLTYRPFYAIQGPPGTGKTTLVSEAVAAYLDEEKAARVLVSAQSGFALDNLAQRILTRIGELDEDGVPTDAMNVAALRITSHSGTPPNERIKPWVRETMTERMAGRIRERVTAALGEVGDGQLVAALSRWRDLLDSTRGENVLLELGDRLERAANLVFATCATATAEAVTPGGTRSRFDWVIVEEAAKAWPTELAMPLACGTAWTLVGDHRQLGAHRRQDFERFLADCAGDPSPELANLAEERTVYLDAFDTFRRLFRPLESDHTTERERERLPLRRLSTQFRMRQPIAEVVSRVFYPSSRELLPDGLPAGRLRTGVDIPLLPLKSPAALAGESVVWLDTREIPDCSDDEPRWSNAGEARLAAALVERLIPQPQPHRHGYSGEPLAVLSPYRRQSGLLRQYDVLRDHVSTLHAFQGREADIVIVSLVRDRRHGPPGVPWSSLGHLTQQNLINVMMSRARRLLVIIGNFSHFAEVDRDYPPSGDEDGDGPFWGRLCTAIQLYGTVLPAASVFEE